MKALLCRTGMAFLSPLYLLIFLVFIVETVASACTVDIEKNTPWDFMFFGAMTCMMISVFPQALMGEDEHIGWNRFCLTMPVKRSQYVSEKYLLTLGFIVLFALLSSVGVIILMVKTTGFDIKDYLLVLSVILCVSLLMMSIDLPMVFRFGTKKGIMLFAGLFLLIFVAGLALFLWASYNDAGRAFFRQVQEADHLVLALCILTGIAVIYTASWLLSIRLYQKREF
ncbi:MAG: ABC-2 transporter permease [Acutalibacteraceae bacterium]|nr:ABC-2 transporter permease [Acutalibacteraceae bacterium]